MIVPPEEKTEDLLAARFALDLTLDHVKEQIAAIDAKLLTRLTKSWELHGSYAARVNIPNRTEWDGKGIEALAQRIGEQPWMRKKYDTTAEMLAKHLDLTTAHQMQTQFKITKPGKPEVLIKQA